MRIADYRMLPNTIDKFREKSYDQERKGTFFMVVSVALVFFVYSLMMLSLDFMENTSAAQLILRFLCTIGIVLVSIIYASYLRYSIEQKIHSSIRYSAALYYAIVTLSIFYQSSITDNVSIMPLLVILIGFGNSWLHSREYIPYLTVVLAGILLLTFRNGFDYYWLIEILIFYLFAIALHLSHVIQKCKIFEYQALIEQERNHDKLTGLMNRRGLNEAFSQYGTEKSLLAMVMVDLDHFKEVNDTFGHDVGDIALMAASSIFKTVFYHDALIGRLGGDEFLILYALNRDEKTQLTADLKKLLTQVPLSFEENSKLVSITFSAGCRIYSRDSIHELSEAISQADELMYQVKQNGRNAVMLLTETGEETVLHGNTLPVKCIACEFKHRTAKAY